MIPLPKKLPKPTYYYENTGTPGNQRKRLWKEITKWTGNPILVDWAAKLIKKYNVPERNDRALARAVQLYSQKHIKFFREHPERFASPLRTIQWGLGDCDDKTIFIATVLRSFRIPVKAKFIRFRGKDGKMVSHVYPLAKLDGKWTALESVHPWPMGEDPEIRAKKRGIKVQSFIIGDK